MEPMRDYISELPKCDLQVHLEGTLALELANTLAQRSGLKLPVKHFHFKSWQAFNQLYQRQLAVLQTEQDFYQLTWHYAQQAHQQNIRHAELYITPQLHTARGVSLATLLSGIHQGLLDSKQQLGISSGLIINFLPKAGVNAANQLLKQILASSEELQEFLLAISLSPDDHWRSLVAFQPLITTAQQQDLAFVAQVSVDRANSSVWQALDELSAIRLDQAVNCLADPTLVHYLSMNQIPITLCPLLDAKLAICPDLSQHPLTEMLDMELIVSISANYPAYFAGYLNDNYCAIQAALDLSKEQIKQLVTNSLDASFIDKDTKQQLQQELSDC
jgi:adenosine deaminase